MLIPVEPLVQEEPRRSLPEIRDQPSIQDILGLHLNLHLVPHTTAGPLVREELENV